MYWSRKRYILEDWLLNAATRTIYAIVVKPLVAALQKPLTKYAIPIVINNKRSSMPQTSPRAEHVRLCLQLILQSYLHQLDAGLTEEKVLELCTEANLPNVPETHE